MGFMNVLERVAGWPRQRQEADFRDLVHQIGDGQEPDPNDVDRVLREACKSLDDLQAAVELLQRRRELRARLDSIPKLTAEQEGIQRQIDAVHQALEEAEKKFDTDFQPLRTDMEQLKDVIRNAERTRNELWDTCSDQKLLAELAEVIEKRQAVRVELEELRSTVNNYRSWAKTGRQNAERTPSKSECKEALAIAEQRERQANQLEKELPTVEKRIADLEQQEAAIRQRMLEP